MSRFFLPATLALVCVPFPALAADRFDADYLSRSGTGHLAVEVELDTPEFGTAMVVPDGDGLSATGVGAGDIFTLNVALSDGVDTLTLEPARECTRAEDGDGCWFDMAVLDRDGRRTGLNARVMVQSDNAIVDASLGVTDTKLPDLGRGVGTQLMLKRVDKRGDIDVFLRFDHDGDPIDFDDHDPPKEGPAPEPSTVDTYRVLTWNVGGLPQTAFSDDEYNPNEDDTLRADEIADRILDNNYDIVVLNEVFNDEMRDELYKQLHIE